MVGIAIKAKALSIKLIIVSKLAALCLPNAASKAVEISPKVALSLASVY